MVEAAHHIWLVLRLFLLFLSAHFGCCCCHPTPSEGWGYGGRPPEVVERKRVTEERAAQRFRSWTVQKEMRGVLFEKYLKHEKIL